MKKYQEIYNDLKEKIRTNVYPAETSLPTEQQLQEMYQVSRDTVRKALAILTVNSNLSQLTGFEPFSKVWKIVRTRSIDGKVSVVDTDYLSSDIVPKMDKEIAKGSIYQYLEKELKLDISYAQKEITVEPTSLEERELMKTQDDYLVLIKSRVFLSDTQQFQYTESKHKIDKFRFVDFARRKHSL